MVRDPVKLFLGSILLIAVVACGGSDSPIPEPPPPPPPPPPPEWFVPDCGAVAGPPVATWSPDAGITIVPNTEPDSPGPTARTGGLAAAYGYGGFLVARSGTGVHRSTDAGCRWTLIHPAQGTTSRLAATDQAIFIAGGVSTDYTLYKIGPDGPVEARSLPFSAESLASSPDAESALYAVARSDEVLWSGDEGNTWTVIAFEPPWMSSMRDIAVNPFNRNHLVVTGSGGTGPGGTIGSGEVAVSFYLGQAWRESSGIAKTPHPDANVYSTTVFHVAFGGTAEETDVWVSGFRKEEKFNPDTDETVEIYRDERFIARSTDGGLTFEDVVIEDGSIEFVQPDLATRPGVVGEVLFQGHGCPLREPKLYHYRASDESVTIITYEAGELNGHGALLFHPTDPDVLYIGRDSTGICD